MNYIHKIIFSLIIIFLLFPPFKILALIDINIASLTELDKITQIGPITAQKIIDTRPFKMIDDLLKVKGIGEKTLQKIKDQGLACVNCEPTLPLQNPKFVIPSLTGNPVINTENSQNTLDSRFRENDTAVPPAPIIYPDGVIINEILPSPQGADEENEWIELYNANNFTVDLSDWRIKDSEGTITIYIIPAGVKILANNFLVFKRPKTKISLNNSADSVNLILPNNKITSSISFTKAPMNQSYSKIDAGTTTQTGWVWNANLTPEKPNIVLADLSKSKNSDNNNNVSIINQDDLASLSNSADLPFSSGQNKSISSNPWFLFIIVAITTIILSAVILIIKLKK